MTNADQYGNGVWEFFYVLAEPEAYEICFHKDGICLREIWDGPDHTHLSPHEASGSGYSIAPASTASRSHGAQSTCGQHTSTITNSEPTNSPTSVK